VEFRVAHENRKKGWRSGFDDEDSIVSFHRQSSSIQGRGAWRGGIRQIEDMIGSSVQGTMMTVRRRVTLSILALALILGILLLGRCNRLPPLENRTVSTALENTEATRLGKAVSPLAAAHPGVSGVYPLRDARDAFAARFLLAEAAERTLDVQYYIWHQDMSGILLFQALHEAAQRGVRVRLLLDDHNTSGMDETIAALDSHSNVEIRLFNPFVIRKPRAIGYLTDFSRLNRRMHNKSFTADNQATIIGGRNVGDEYFGATEGVLFADLDVIAVGPVVDAVSSDFDRYWASESSYPADRLVPPVSAAQIEELAAAASRAERDPAAVAYLGAIRRSPFVGELIEGTLPLEWAATRMISDDPAKALGRAVREQLLFHQMQAIFGRPGSRFDLVSPYFVPTADGVDTFVGWAEEGVEIRVLTNSLEATDVAAVHAGYAKRRKALLQAGVTLYELRLAPAAPMERRAGFGSGAGSGSGSGSGPQVGSSGSSLHAKTFAVDGARLFIGSFNFDPRSASLNTEIGFVIDSPKLAGQMAVVFEGDVPANAYEVQLSDAGQLVWIERRDGVLLRHDTEPGTSFWQRAGVRFLSILPIEGLL
jgi:putative cardiolipin synthase